MVFENILDDPFDRNFVCHVEGQEQLENILTLGACSYITHAGLAFDRIPEAGARHPAHILVGRFCSFADGSTFNVGLNHSHRGATSTFPFDDPQRIKRLAAYGVETPRPFECPKNFRARANRYQNIFGHDVWIGYGVSFMGGAIVGTGAIVGANSVVAKNIPPYSIAVGNPARVVKYRFDEATIKKFLAVKWWNWSLERILANCKFMKDAEKFLDLHWSPELENFPQDEIGNRVEELRAQGFTVYNFVADFRAKNPLWLRVIAGFCQSNFENVKLIIWLDKNSTNADFNLLNDAVNIFGNGAGRNILVVDGSEKISPHALRSATHFIMTREMTTLECMDWLWNTDVKIVSALDENIFDGEPPVDWQTLNH